ncbi:ATP-binding protein [uncultured Catenibacterium sp.]|uniref:ATP-binding protein n=2 Tax=Catenibacterium TaxID=135858 RepID=UPI00263897E7|nr:ATP-binding protein [uncultured Catenibacterium sp.]
MNVEVQFQNYKNFKLLKVGEYMKTIVRKNYLNRIIELNGTPDIKIITGIRRSGKSKLMQAYIEYLKTNCDDINIIFIDFMDLEFEEIKEYHALHSYVEQHYVAGKMNYLFVDEVQMCPKFELAINSLYSKGKYDIYLTGSNAFLLSADLATLFTGRYIEIHVFPFSFQEYCEYYSDVSDKDKLFDEYSFKGGLAGSYLYPNDRDRVTYIKEVYETIVTRDLVQKYALPDTTVLQRLSEFLMDNISNLTSPNKVSQLLTANNVSTTHVTVRKYIKYLCNAFVFYDIKRYDIRGKKYLESSEKFYLCDTGIRYAILGSRNMDYGRVYENMVCIELLRRGYDVYVGKLYQKEIDFVAQRGSEKIYIQVSDNISAQETFEREYSPLLQIRDAYPKMIIARTRHPKYSYEGIVIYDIAEWLLEE